MGKLILFSTCEKYHCFYRMIGVDKRAQPKYEKMSPLGTLPKFKCIGINRNIECACHIC